MNHRFLFCVLAWRRVNRRTYETPTCLFAGLEQIYQEIL